MKIFVSYKFRGVNKAQLKKKLELISSVLEKNGHQTFIHFRDGRNWKAKDYPLNKTLKNAFGAIQKNDVVLALVDNHTKSVGMFLELGFAKALGKKVILLIAQKCSYPALEAISNQIIKFNNLQDLPQKLAKI